MTDNEDGFSEYEEGLRRKGKIAKIGRYVTIVLLGLFALGYYASLHMSQEARPGPTTPEEFERALDEALLDSHQRSQDAAAASGQEGESP